MVNYKNIILTTNHLVKIQDEYVKAIDTTDKKI